ncbi:MAG: tRNA epoxyqueuosine(34) reductase QueG [Nitrospiria bacterium]
MSLTSEIRELACQLGFFKLGVARVQSFPQLNFLESWLRDGKHGEMTWIERTKEKRQNPELVLKDARSIIVVGLNYYVQEPSEFIGPGKISRYAWGVDYHLIMEERLEQLTQRVLNRLPDARAKFYADTGPVMEKAWAEKAGLGWIGKNTNLIAPGHGSYLFLGVILVDKEWDAYDSPGTDLCGTCTLCIQTCPTGALTPYQLDSTKCISYLTIEKKGDFTKEQKSSIGEWVYGCDDCQDICPWNISPQISFEPGFNNFNPFLKALFSQTLSETDFNQMFKKSPLKRLKFTGLKRNLQSTEENRASNGLPWEGEF